MITDEKKNGNGTRTCVCGVTFDRLSMRQVVRHVDESIKTRRKTAISVVNVAKLVNMRKDALLRESVESGDLILADGMPLVWLSRFRPAPLPERVAGIDLMFELFTLADQKGLRVFLLGATKKTLERVVELARERYPRMVIAGYRDGYFADYEHEAVATQIRDSAADILLVAMTSPKKEVFMRKWGDFMDVPICHGVGGSFDVMAGVTRRAPIWMQRWGLEWFYRLAQEPRRLWRRYLQTNVAFLRRAPRCLICRRDGADCKHTRPDHAAGGAGAFATSPTNGNGHR